MAKKKILIVDDSADTRLVVSARLKKHGYDTVFAADALQAMSVAKERPDAILLDFAKLQEAQSLSNALVRTVEIAMNAVNGLYDDDAGRYAKKGQPDQRIAIRLMFHEA